MKTNSLINAFFAWTLLFVLCSIVSAQSSSVGFKSGIRIATKTEAIYENSRRMSIRPLDKWETINGKDVLHRRLIDAQNGIFFGYDVEVSRTNDPNKFNVAVRPLSYKSDSNSVAEKAEIEKYTAAPLPKFPAQTVVENGDIIKLDLLENAEKKIKITDYLKIYSDSKPYATSFSELQPTKDFTLDDVNLKLEGFEIFINGKIIGKMGGGVSGSNIYFTVPNHGRIIVSPFPREGYNLQKIGNIIDNKLTFTIGADKYEVVSKSPVLSDGGNWNAWIMHDPGYQKKHNNPKYADSIEVGAGDLKFFFEKQELGSLQK